MCQVLITWHGSIRKVTGAERSDYGGALHPQNGLNTGRIASRIVPQPPCTMKLRYQGVMASWLEASRSTRINAMHISLQLAAS